MDRGDFKLLQNSIFPDKDGGNVFVEMEAGSIILTEKVTNIIFFYVPSLFSDNFHNPGMVNH